MKKILYFSGGRTSGFMLHLLLDQLGLEEFNRQYMVCFSNTGKEMMETLEFVHQVEQQWGVPIIWLEYARVPAIFVPRGVYPTDKRNKNLAAQVERGETTHWFRRVSFDTAATNGEPFDELLEWMSVLPNPLSRACSSELKIRTGFRYLFSLGYKEFHSLIGIRKDEEHRAIQILADTPAFNFPEFPLVENKITEGDVLAFWKHNSFDLQLESYEGNCDQCFLKAIWKQVQVERDRPGSVNWWKGWEAKKAIQAGEGTGAAFRIGRPYTKIETLARSGKVIPRRKKDVDIPCSCAERGFKDASDLI